MYERIQTEPDVSGNEKRAVIEAAVAHVGSSATRAVRIIVHAHEVPSRIVRIRIVRKQMEGILTPFFMTTFPLSRFITKSSPGPVSQAGISIGRISSRL